MRMIQSSARRSGASVLVLGVLAAFTSGCGIAPPTSPVSLESSGRVVKPAASADTMTGTWTTLASVWVNKGEVKTVSGGRYTIQFVRGALSQGAQVTIAEQDPSACGVMIGPSGTKLSKASTLTISYAGSTQDLAGPALQLYHLNDATNMWEPVAATNDILGHKVTANVTALGGYTLSALPPGKAGW